MPTQEQVVADGSLVLSFGKFKGGTVAQVFHQASWYLAWAGNKGLLPTENLFVYAATQCKKEQAEEDKMGQYLFGHEDWGNRE